VWRHYIIYLCYVGIHISVKLDRDQVDADVGIFSEYRPIPICSPIYIVHPKLLLFTTADRDNAQPLLLTD
jgi:hypothetical protein